MSERLDGNAIIKCPSCGATSTVRDLRTKRSECHWCQSAWYDGTSDWVTVARIVEVAK